MAHTVAEIAAALGTTWEGDGDLAITRASEPATAGPDALALAMKPDYADGLAQGRARAAVLWPGADWRALGLEAAILAPRPRMALAGITRLMDPWHPMAPGVHPSAVIDPSATLAEDVSVGPFVVIGAHASIGAGSRIQAHASIGDGATLGPDCLIREGARVCHHVRLGARVILHPGAVIGSDGFSYVTPETSGVEEIRRSLGQRSVTPPQHWERIHSLGSVTLGDDVEVGANSTIDRGTIRDTTVGAGTRIDNLVMLGHNVQVGRDCLLCSQVGIAGSTRVGDRVVLAGQVGVNDNIFIGDDVIAAGATKIYSNAPAGRVLMGAPAMKMEAHLEAYKALRRLPRLLRRLEAADAARQKPVSNPADSD
ncbi:UDP-3-O-(3-hydroxymyristoyl)glucosamine N-acyltransferase [Rhodobaculum claviforme]|uniref:UDP-3-O-acylglucosamine N-acyltransferase n=1 Tax=Rhodobaculum claviforme TaxID=1549854 RepID=A0A934WK54_9RHOB|nr:UDP-3-O-(3-hydroxymyristoyl)glucosamine N-acyltransferase [Rhodobaculum claviforme]MBK5928756.1 UDP-3-O-(3-hydroxymyristoyl)glucosamine N-acyltransferase [Rhodobaculum claviforme]